MNRSTQGTPRQRRRALRARLAKLRRGQLGALRSRRRSRRRGLIATLGLLLLLILRNCSCAEEEPGPRHTVAQTTRTSTTTPELEASTSGRREARRARVRRRRRPKLTPPRPRAPGWLDDFRLQVAARSVRLARCFEGAERPGAMRWSCAIDPGTGAVSDQSFEALGPAPEVDAAQRRCLREALSEPAYRLTAASSRLVPERVRIVLEF